MKLLSVRYGSRLTLLTLFLGGLMAPSQAQQVYFNNFDGTQTFGAGATGGLSGITTTVGVQGFAGLGPLGNQFGGNLLQNTATGNPATATTLTLNNLPAHTSVDIDFLLAVIDSWDSDNGSVSPDLFNVTVDNVSVFQTTFANTSGSNNYAPPVGGDIGSGAQLRGFAGFLDRAYNMALEPTLGAISHNSSSMTIAWFGSGNGWQGGEDESFGLDNVTITLSGGGSTSAPEPGTLGLMSLGVLGVLRARRARRA